ncbi:MAG TPA: hypothetical protein VIY48_17960, partial [Candidatus Paceibacterota bacterium]
MQAPHVPDLRHSGYFAIALDDETDRAPPMPEKPPVAGLPATDDAGSHMHVVPPVAGLPATDAIEPPTPEEPPVAGLPAT